MTADPCPPARAARARPRPAAGSDGLDQHVDRAAAGEADVPRLLVADPVADDPGVAGRARALDLLGRGALDAAAADRAGDPPVGRVRAGRRPPAAAPSRTCARRRPGRAAAPSACQASERVEQLLHRSGLAVGRSMARRRRRAGAGVDGGPTWRRQRRVRGGLAAPPRVAGPDAAQDLAEPLEAGDRAGRQEVVDVRIGGAHPAGQRLVAGRAGQRVEPDQAMAVAAQAGRLGGDERRVAAVPAVADTTITTPRRPQRPAAPSAG